MHELGLLTGVVAAVVATTGARAVHRVGLRVGARSGAIPEALHGAWPLATADSPLADAELLIETIPAAIWCPACAATHEVDQFYAWCCPKCQTPTGVLAQGREFEVAYVDVEQAAHESSQLASS